MESCYIPNNPHYGLQVDGSALGGVGAGGGGAVVLGGGGVGGGVGGAGTPGPAPTYWTPEDMGSFSLPALDLDPLPSLFPFSPCASSCKSEFTPLKEKQPHDMADVLLSLKHAVVHPGQAAAAAAAAAAGQLSPTSAFAAGAYGAAAAAAAAGGAGPGGGVGVGVQPCAMGQPPPPSYQGHAASLSYTVHPHQMMSPGGYGSSQYCPAGSQDQMFGAAATSAPQSAQHHNMFPSMSVNVSMNMTMHGYPNMADNLQHQVTCPQMQWGPPPPNPSPVYPQTPQGLLSPQAYAGGATYSFTADFRPPAVAAEPSPLLAANSSFKPVISKVVSFSPPCAGVQPPAPPRSAGGGAGRQRPMGGGGGSFAGKMAAAAQAASALGNGGGAGGAGGDDAQRPNLCRICGKTYARPSTLKTHLRTHSGEKPYRCGDCNKSFSQAANLTAHVRTHSGEKPFRCPICDRRFSQSSSVTTHMRTHSGERPYRCRLCKKAFSDSSTLTKHLRIHSGEKPYQCKLCLLRFSQSGNLNRHMRVHGGGGGGGVGGAGGASALTAGSGALAGPA